MSLHATFIEHTFVSILALYVTLECAVTILQTRAAEKSCGRVPEGFEKKLTLAGIRKAADYTGELAQPFTAVFTSYPPMISSKQLFSI